MSAPRWTRALLARLAEPDRCDEVLGDLDEAHGKRVSRWGRTVAAVLTSAEALDMALALRGQRGQVLRRFRGNVPPDLGAARRRRMPPVSWLDFKLGLRMLVKYPGLTLVAGFAMAFTVAVGAGTFEFVTQVLRPRLPLDDGARIVALELTDTETGEPERRIAFDFVRWRERLEGVEDLGAYRGASLNLVIDGDVGSPAYVAAMTVSGFDLARVPPLMGRFLIAADEADGASPAVVLSHELWRSRFAGDPNVVGRTVRLGGEQTTVVGVMPEGFGFPISQDAWIPLRASALEAARREGGAIQVFARLRESATQAGVLAEMSTLSAQMASDFPDTHQNLVPRVMPFGQAFLGVPAGVWSAYSLGLLSFNVIPILLLLLIAANIALLMFARAATRESEIVVRTALGAGRARIVGQLFAEALVLGALAAAAGLGAASIGLRWFFAVVEGAVLGGAPLPFWAHASLSPMTVVYAGLLTLLGATLAGVLPGLKVTRSLGSRLRASNAGGGGLAFGGVWTAVIVTQVAITVPFPAVVFALRQERTGIEEVTIGVPVEQYFVARVEMDARPAETREALLERYARSVDELERRLEADTRVISVTRADRLPRMYHPWNSIEVLEGATEPPDERGHRVGQAFVALDYFEALEVPILVGRGFGSGDVGADARAVIVTTSFVDRVLGDRNALGKHVRYIADERDRDPRADGPWYEIVGVVRDLGVGSGFGPQGIYHPLDPASALPVFIAAHVRGDPLGLAPTLRAAALAVDPALEIHAPMSLAEVVRDDLDFYDFWITLVVVVSGIALLLSLAGIYAAMSFAVSRRTREIGIRVALGADRKRIVTSIFRRPLLQVGAGVLVGTALTVGLMGSLTGGLDLVEAASIAVYAALVCAVCMLACVVPTRRALGVEPTDALRAE